jgi:hypothetical protein
MPDYPDKITSEDQLEELLSRPGTDLEEAFRRADGDFLFLGIGGKIGPSLSGMAARACNNAGVRKRIIGVDRYISPDLQKSLNSLEIETLRGDLLDTGFIKSLPAARNIFFLAGMKFGAVDNLPLTWAVNSYLPALVADKFSGSRISVFSTGCVYPLVTVGSGGSTENDPPAPLGEYAQSCLGRERMFEYGSLKNNTEIILIRLNYSVELRYGVLLDIALKVKNSIPVDLSMGYFNVIWQGDVNDFVLRSVEYAESPAKVLNITGPEILSVRNVALEFGQLFGIDPRFINSEDETALLSNPSEAIKLFGEPKTPINQVIKWIAGWLDDNGRILNKPTHFETRDGKY